MNFLQILSICLVVVVLVVMVVQLFGWRRRSLRDPEAILAKIRRHGPLLEYVEKLENISVDDDALWKAVGMVKGLIQLPRHASAVLSLLEALEIRGQAEAEFQINVRRVEITALACLGCVLDALFRLFIKDMPRTYLRVAATQYCQICLSLDTLVSVYRPDMIDRVMECL